MLIRKKKKKPFGIKNVILFLKDKLVLFMLLSGPFAMSGDKANKLQGMDTQILVDALAVIMGHEEKELCKPGTVALVLMLETASTILGSKDRVR